MMAYHHHRKLMPDSDFISNLTNLTQACATVCDPNNTQRLCSNSSCHIICPLLCPPPPFVFSLAPFFSPPPPNIPKTHSKLSPALKISIAFLIATFSIFLIYTLYKFFTIWFKSRRNNQPDDVGPVGDDFIHEDHGPELDHPIWYIRTIGLQPTVISAITIAKYKRGDGLVEGTDCSICLCEFQEDETLRLLPKCSHAFHIPCIDTWLTSHTNCPLCRAGIVKIGEPNLSLSLSLPLPVPVGDNSVHVEETPVGVSETSVELVRVTEDGSSELRIDHESEDETEMGFSDSLGRRSASTDCLSVEIANSQSEGYLGTKLDKANDLNSGSVPTRVGSSCSIGRSLQRGPDFIKRSLSCSGKVLFSRQISR